MKGFKRLCSRLLTFALVFCFALLFAVANVSFAGPLGLFPNFTPLRTAGNVASAPFRGGCGSALGEARNVRRARRGYSGSCANGACQAPTQAPGKAVQKK